MVEEEFPEIVELKAMQRQRHRRVIAGLIVSGLASMGGGLAIFALSGGERPAVGGGAVGIILIGVGAILVARGIFSAVTDYDLRPRHDLDPLVLAEYDDSVSAEPGDNEEPPKGSSA